MLLWRAYPKLPSKVLQYKEALPLLRKRPKQLWLESTLRDGDSPISLSEPYSILFSPIHREPSAEKIPYRTKNSPLSQEVLPRSLLGPLANKRNWQTRYRLLS